MASENSNDAVVSEKRQGLKASWELPNDRASADATTQDKPLGADQVGDIPTNYENKHVSYPDATSFEVKKSPGRLG
ncbi:hypothetical protein [Paenibacillus hamazuiensis]|uniref:hypothetical protein n=1 Tax=Paenibacillus hamazuiensis TaxID=2936508 RepID=UPI00200F4CA6|nr:hypothetical protein [Paenibacillus hamazuiensis]